MLAIIEACPKALCVVFKKEVAEIILVKQIARLLRAIPMDRKDVRSSLKIINKMTEDVKTGRIMLYFRKEPEAEMVTGYWSLKREPLKVP